MCVCAFFLSICRVLAASAGVQHNFYYDNHRSVVLVLRVCVNTVCNALGWWKDRDVSPSFSFYHFDSASLSLSLLFARSLSHFALHFSHFSVIRVISLSPNTQNAVSLEEV